mgnify:CR=1 FL=1
MEAGNKVLSSDKPSTTWLGFMLTLKLNATTSAPCAVAACAMSRTGVCVPNDTQRQPCKVSKLSTINKPKPCASCGKVVNNTVRYRMVLEMPK